MRPPLSDLIQAVKACGRCPGHRWRGVGFDLPLIRPPLVSDLELNGVPLAPFLMPPGRRTLADLRVAYEQYVETWNYGVLDDLFLPRTKYWLFPKSGSRQEHLLGLLWAIARRGGFPFHAEGNTIIVRGDTFTIGVDNGRILSRFSHQVLPDFDYSGALLKYSNTNGAVCRENDLAEYYRNLGRHKDWWIARTYFSLLYHIFIDTSALADALYRKDNK